MNIKLLDCTLRDGGYVNDWNFGKDTIITIFERLVASNVDIIEIGFIDHSRLFNEDYSIYPDTNSINKIYSKLEKKNSLIVGMIDFGTCDIEFVQPAKESFLDGVRVIFKKEKLVEAFSFINKLISLGYIVFAQAVSITSYNDKELLQFIDIANQVKPHYVSIVDTYGLLHPNELFRVTKAMDQNLLPQISLGFHGHNNFQMAYANSISFLDLKINRNVVVDGTLYGLGKSAGNAPIELLSMYLNDFYSKSYDTNQLLEAIQISILDIHKNNPWGYSFFYYLAAANKCHPNYVSFLINKRTLSISSINSVLGLIDFNKKLSFDKKHIEEIYLHHQKNEFNDNESLQNLIKFFESKKVLLIGPGNSVINNQDLIKNFIDEVNPLVVAINYIPKVIEIDSIFITNSQRYFQLRTKLSSTNAKLIVTSNVNFFENKPFQKLNYSSLIDEKAEFPDNSLHMMIRLLNKLHCKKIFLAGFDGYSPDQINYFDRSMQYSFVKDKSDNLNKVGKDFITEMSKFIDILFITKSYYI
jgi:4-hydroxy 2-oxovalerate aldolase